MTFLQPYILWALPLVLVPVLIHFLNRMRYRTVAWAAMMFLLAATRQSVRHAKLREILLLICRVAVVLFLLIFLARPLAGGWLGWAFHGAPDTVVLLLDRSPSMELNGKRAAVVRRLAEAARELEGRTRFVLIDSATRKPTEVSSPSFLAELPQTQPADASGNIPDLLQAAADYVAASQSGRTEFWLASDLQSADWQPDNAARWAEVSARISALPQDVRVRLLAAREAGSIDNVAVNVVEARRRKVGTKTELVLSIELTRNVSAGASPSPTATEIPVTVVIEGARSVVNVKIETSGGSGVSPRSGENTGRGGDAAPTLRFQHKIDLGDRTTRGWGWVELPSDANLRDNTSYFVFDGERHLRSVVAASDAEVGRVLSLAAAPAPELLNQSSAIIVPSEFPLREMNDVALVVWQAGDPDRVRGFVEGGGLALVFPAKDAGEEIKTHITNWRANEGPLASTDEGEELPVRELMVTRRAALPGKGTVLATFDDGKAFLTREQVGKGYLYSCATLPEKQWSSLTEGTVLVPMMQRILREGGRRLGAVVAQTCGVEALGEARRVDKETGAGEAGIYQRGAELVALNRPASEDVSEFVEPDLVKALFGSVQVRVFEEKDQTGKLAGEIWRVFVWLMLFALIGEAVLTMATKEAPRRSDLQSRPAGQPAEVIR
ncbi:MAG: BatA domain-containing protein [Verrucomicrobiota bacterium]